MMSLSITNANTPPVQFPLWVAKYQTLIHSNVLGEHTLFHCENTGSHQVHCRRQHNASDRTPNFVEPQICAGGFNDILWLRLDAKTVDKHTKPGKQQLSSASRDVTGSSNGAHPVF